MADKRISDLNLHTSLELSDSLPIINNNETKKTTYGSLYYGIRDGVVSGSQQISDFGFATTGSNVFIGNETITGSFLVSGSTTQIGNNTLEGNTLLVGTIGITGNSTLTGSFLVSGSTTQIGNNTLLGNTQLYGNIDVSGSTKFHNHLIEMTGSMFTSGSQVITGSLDINGNINVASGSAFYRWGNKLFNYGAFSDTTIQTASVAQEDTELLMRFNTTDIGGHGIYIASGSRAYVENTGIYNIQFSAQFDRFSSSGIKVLSIWLKKDGNNVPNSCTDIVVSGGASEGAVVAAWNFVYPIEAGHYVELAWSTPDHNIGISSLGTRTTPIRPAVPSTILTLTQIA